MNIVSLVMQYLAPALVGRMASSLGIGEGLAQKAIAAAVPAILAGLVGKASTPEGARTLSNTIGQQDPGLLGNLGSILGGAQQGSLVGTGATVLGSLLGGNQVGALTGALGKFAGLGDSASKGLVGMLAPVVLGQLGQVQKKSGLDAGGLASLLTSQKDNIASAMPAGFAQLLGGTGLLDSVAGKLNTAAPAAAPVARPVEAPRPSSGGVPSWLWLGLAVLAALAAWKFMSRPHEVAAPKAPAPAVAVPAATPAVAPAVEVGKQATAIVDGLRKSFAGIKSKADAEAVLPAIRDANGKLGVLTEQYNKLDATGRKTVADLIASLVPNLKTLIDAALAIPGVGDFLRQPADDILGRLGALAKG